MHSQRCYHCANPVNPSDQRCLACNRLLILRGNGKTYRLVRELGATNLSIVYKALDTQINRICAIKSAVSTMFETEPAILVQHASRFPFIPHIYDIWNDGLYTFLVMEYIEGRTLDEVQPKPWPVAHVNDFLGTILVYLDQLHKAGIIHRDLKPRNMMHTPLGRCPYMLLDFGISKQSSVAQTVVRNFGTPDYAPPEQFNGTSTDARSDLYSLGATAYELLTGSPPPTADERTNGTPLTFPAYLSGTEFEDVLLWMLELNPARRPPNARLALHLLTSIASLPSARPFSGQTSSIHFAPTRRNPPPASAAARAAGRSNTRRMPAPESSAPPPLPKQIADVCLLHTLHGHQAKINSLVFHPNGRLLATASDDTIVYLWRVADGSAVRTLNGSTHWVNSVAFSPDGQMLVSGGSDEMIRLWNVRDQRLRRIWNVGGFLDWVNSLAFSPDGQMLASGSGDAAVRLWRVADGALLHECRRDEAMDGALSIAFSPDGQMLASGSGDAVVRLWRVADGALLCQSNGTGATKEVLSVAFSPDGQMLASGSGDAVVRLWRVADGALLRDMREMKITGFVNGRPNGIRCVAFSPDGQVLASGSSDATVRLWRVADGVLLHSWKVTQPPNRVRTLAFSPDGQVLATGSDEQTVQLWQLIYGDSAYG